MARHGFTDRKRHYSATEHDESPCPTKSRFHGHHEWLEERHQSYGDYRSREERAEHSDHNAHRWQVEMTNPHHSRRGIRTYHESRRSSCSLYQRSRHDNQIAGPPIPERPPSPKPCPLHVLRFLENQEPREVLLELLSGRSGALLHFQQSVDHDCVKVELLIKVLARACQSNYSPELLRQLLTLVIASRFLEPSGTGILMRYLANNSGDLKVHIVIAVTEIIKALLRYLPSVSQGYVTQVMSQLDNWTLNQKDMWDTKVQEAVEQVKKVSEILRNITEQKTMNCREENDEYNDEEPPDDFRKIPIIPTVAELTTDDQPFLRKNIVRGKYRDVNHYLDVQYRLLREDFVGPLREGLKAVLESKKRNVRIGRLSDIRFYRQVHILTPHCTPKCLMYRIQFDVTQFKNIRWETSKRLNSGTLVALSSDNFTNIILATVVSTRVQGQGFVDVCFEGCNTQIINVNPYTCYEMIESSSAYFESYRHVLTRLQEFEPGELPFEKYILNHNSNSRSPVGAPQYLRYAHLDFCCLIGEHQSNQSSAINMPWPLYHLKHFYDHSQKNFQTATNYYMREDRGHRREFGEDWHLADDNDDDYSEVPILDLEAWPSHELLGLDSSQFAALQTAMTKEFVTIQGPPGTGKTFIGLKIVQLLLSNLYKFGSDFGPILIVCYTNHALDQFLEGVIKVCGLLAGDLVRVGGRSTSENELLQDCMLFKVRKEYTRAKFNNANALFNTRDIISHVKKEMSQNQQDITVSTAYIEYAHSWLIHECCLSSFMTACQWRSLATGSYVGSNSLLSVWLSGQPVDGNLNTQNLILEELMPPELARQNDQSESENSLDHLTDIRNFSRTYLEEMGVFIWETVEDGEISENKNRCFTIRTDPTHVHSMSEEECSTVVNIWLLSTEDRWRLYNYWASCYCNKKAFAVYQCTLQYNKLSSQLAELNSETDYQALKHAQVIGITTTGAAKYRQLIQRVQPKIIIVEEAAEVLEAHIITTLSARCEHLIMIGDHQQLRPNPTVYKLAKQYHLDISLFERMVKNNVHCDQLTIQHRMRPEIAKLIVPHIYKLLHNHKSVLMYDNIRGINGNVFFISHSELESDVDDSKTRSNEHEAQFIAGLCRYLLKQGYESSNITVLTPYTGQMFLLRRLIPKAEFNGVRITPVDNYQGEENDIVLLSLVRSNAEGKIGFLQNVNRVCVALSRARKGLFIIGNMKMLSERSPMWRNFARDMKKDGVLVDALPLWCQNHPDTVTLVKCGNDFEKVPEGGCMLDCGQRLPCGHVCTMRCHPTDRNHQSYICRKPCVKSCENEHRCTKQCWEECGQCETIVDKTIPLCGHTQKMKCPELPDNFECKMPCEKVYNDCGHLCLKRCGENCSEKCEFIVPDREWPCGHKLSVACFNNSENFPCNFTVKKDLPCGHEADVKCSQDISLYRCTIEVQLKLCDDETHRNYSICHCQATDASRMKCGKLVEVICPRNEKHKYRIKCHQRKDAKCPLSCNCKLPCSHPCVGKCGECANKNRHKTCNFQCLKTLNCGHKYLGVCSELCPPCNQPCITYCGHEERTEPCGEVWKNCHEPCRWSCPHHQCRLECFDPCMRPPCNCWCTACLPCGHRCMGLCGEACVCGHCGRYRLNLTRGLRLVQLQPCGHIVDVNTMDTWVQKSVSGYPCQPQPVTCCQCHQLVLFCPRYNHHIKQFVLDTNAVKIAVRKVQTVNFALDSFWPDKMNDFRHRFLGSSTEYQVVTVGKKDVNFSSLSLGALCIWQECWNILQQCRLKETSLKYTQICLRRLKEERESLEEVFVLRNVQSLVQKIVSMRVMYLHLHVRRLMIFIEKPPRLVNMLQNIFDESRSLVNDTNYFSVLSMTTYLNNTLMQNFHPKFTENIDNLLLHLDAYFQPNLMGSIHSDKWIVCSRRHAFGIAADANVTPSCRKCSDRSSLSSSRAVVNDVDVENILRSIIIGGDDASPNFSLPSPASPSYSPTSPSYIPASPSYSPASPQ